MTLKKSLLATPAFSFLIIILFSIMAVTFGHPEKKGIYTLRLDDRIYIAQAAEHESVYNAGEKNFTKLDVSKPDNISKIFGTQGSFAWIKIDFDVPEPLRYEDLGLYIPYLHFAEKVWINNIYAGEYGVFPPEELSAQYVAHFFSFPQTYLHQNGTNTIMIKLWVHGFCEFPKGAFVSTLENAHHSEKIRTFTHSTIYVLFEGGMFASYVIYLVMFYYRRKEKENIYYSLLNLFTIIFQTMYFAPVVPWFSTNFVSYLFFMKIVMCVPLFLAVYCATGFSTSFVGLKFSKRMKIVRILLVAIPSVLTCAAPDYNFMMKVCIPAFIFTFIQFQISSNMVIKAAFKPETRRRALHIIWGFFPLLSGLIADFIIRFIFHNHNQQFFFILGWQVSVIYYNILLTHRFNKAFNQNQYLSQNLQKEVDLRTSELQMSRERLKEQLAHEEIDLEMAEIIQKKFFPKPNHNFVGWDFAVLYEPMAKVSGDFFDFYDEGSTLKGVSIFDVSGHGLASGLITMLSKEIVYSAFKRGYKESKVSEILQDIDIRLRRAKGSVENYLTGLICRCHKTDSKDAVTVDISNAGHPYPVLYSTKLKESHAIRTGGEEKNFGALGLSEVDTSFYDISIKMIPGDVLILYSDGLTEAENANGEQFGSKNIITVLNKSKYKSAKQILSDLLSVWKNFTNTSELSDDLTIIVLKREPSENFVEELERLD